MTADVDGIAGDRIRSFVERIVRLKEEQDQIAADIRDIYAEAKGEGFDKTALGKLVTYLVKRAKNPDALAEQETIFDLYLEAYTNAAGPRTRMRVPACEDPPHDPETGEIIPGPGEQAGDEANAAEASVSAQADAPESVMAGETAPLSNARPESPPAAQDRGALMEGPDGSAASTVGITGGTLPVEAEQSVTAAGAGEGAAAPVDPAPAPDGPKTYDPLLDPKHEVTPFFRSLLCAEYDLEEERFDDFRACLLAGQSKEAALQIARAGAC